MLLLLNACKPVPATSPNPLTAIFQHPKLVPFAAQADSLKIQVIYTQIDRDAQQRPSFTSYYFRHRPDEYFYPASTVKLPTAIVALEQLEKLPGVTAATAMATDSVRPSQSAVAITGAPNNPPSVAQYVEQIMVASDNNAYNRLYELVGQEPLNERLHELGFVNTRLLHRLSIALPPEENRHTNPIRFLNFDEQSDSWTEVHHQPARYSSKSYLPEQDILLGKAHYAGGKLIDRPRSFRANNFFPLQEQQEVLKKLFFPETSEPAFALSEAVRQQLIGFMGLYPHESTLYKSDTSLYDGYVKFFLYGDTKAPADKNIRIFNKIGQAYGFIQDNAYVVDTENDVEFLLSAVINVNKNQTLNDGVYEYEELGYPFLAELGRQVYKHDLERKREVKPELSYLQKWVKTIASR